jgi:TIR domain
MPRWFLSYHTPDEKLAERLKASIEQKDPASSVFFAPSDLRAGGAWTAQFAQEIARANAFILLVGEAGVGKWQVPEYDEALDRWVKSEPLFPLVVVLLEGQTAPGLPFLRRLHRIVTSNPASEKDIAGFSMPRRASVRTSPSCGYKRLTTAASKRWGRRTAITSSVGPGRRSRRSTRWPLKAGSRR